MSVDVFAGALTSSLLSPSAELAALASLALVGFMLALSLCADIGTANIALMTTVMQQGLRNGLWLGMGTIVGDAIYLIATLTGMAYLLQFTPVQWGIWVIGSLVLIVMAVHMLRLGLRPPPPITAPTMRTQAEECYDHQSARHLPQHAARQFAKGALLALSSPSGIIWFATAGGALINQIRFESSAEYGIFISGFLLASLLWTIGIAIVVHKSGALLGTKIMRITYLASAGLFLILAIGVVASGYQNLLGRH